jgi:hypothetical protein
MQVEQRAPLVEQRRIRRIQVLGCVLFLGVEDARGEAITRPRASWIGIVSRPRKRS